MKKTLIVTLLAGLVACGDKPTIAVAHATPVAKAEAIEVAKVDPDQELALRVTRAIEEAKLHGIDAVAVDGVVTLWGTTPTRQAQLRAAEIAAGVEGVRAVENRLQVLVGS
jgi:osmotically-inducible protein OsmY